MLPLNSRWLSRLFILFLVPAAYLTELQTYIRVADDYPFASRFESGLIEAVRADWAAMGLRRSVGKIANLPLCGSPVEVTGWLCVGLHLATVLLFQAVAARLLRSDFTATVLAVLLGAFPGVYMAVTWACGTYVVTMTLFFLAGLWVLLRAAEEPDKKDWPAALIAFVLLFLSCVFGEQLIFASALTGLLAWTSGDRPDAARRPWSAAFAQPWVWAPAIAVGIYLLLAILTLPAQPVRHAPPAHFDPLNFNPRTLLSVWYHQLRHIDMLQPWTQPGVFSVVFSTWSPARWGGAGLLVLAACWFGRQFMATDRCAPEPVPSTRAWFVLAAMLLAVSFVHALAGGFSGSSRHSYAPLALGLFFVGCSARRFARRMKSVASWRLYFFALLAAGSVATAWLVTGVSRFELQRHDALLNFLATHPQPGPVQIEFAPPLYRFWPSMRRLANPLDAAWVINCGLEYRRAPKIEEFTTAAGATIVVGGNSAPFAFEVRERSGR